MLDFAVHSPSATLLIHSLTADPGPFHPHLGLRLRLRSEPRAEQLCCILQSKRSPHAEKRPPQRSPTKLTQIQRWEEQRGVQCQRNVAWHEAVAITAKQEALPVVHCPSWLARSGLPTLLGPVVDMLGQGCASWASSVKRCEEDCAETFLHRHWLCAGNLFDHPNEAAKRAHQGPSRRAQVEATDTPCLWFRGLLPAEFSMGLLPPPASEETAMVFGAGRASTPGYLIRNHPLYWYTDGSGGKYGQDARLVRVSPARYLSLSEQRPGSFIWTAPWRVTGV